MCTHSVCELLSTVVTYDSKVKVHIITTTMYSSAVAIMKPVLLSCLKCLHSHVLYY